MKGKRAYVRFRLTDGRGVQLFHRSNIEADLEELDRFNDDGSFKKRVLHSEEREELQRKIQAEIDLMEETYGVMKEKGMQITSKTLEEAMERAKIPELSMTKAQTESLLSRFNRFINEYYAGGNIGKARYNAYKVLEGILNRYLIIRKKTSYRPIDFQKRDLVDFRSFLFNEYKYVPYHKSLYKEVKQVPTAPRSQNTVSAKLKALNTFYNVLQVNGEMIDENRIPVITPFSLTKQEQSTMMVQRYNEPVCLHQDEYNKVRACEVPESLQEAKEAFMVMCTLGCRISDMKRMSMDKIKVNPDGIPFVSYKPIKTARVDRLDDMVETPLIHSTLEIIKKNNFTFHILNNERGHEGFNAKIKRILKEAKIDRLCKVYDEDANENVDTPLYELGSSKLTRKTFVDMINELQIDLLAAGLHKSDAVKRYQENSITKRFKLICAAFGEQMYKVDEDLNVIE